LRFRASGFGLEVSGFVFEGFGLRVGLTIQPGYENLDLGDLELE